MSTDLRKQVEHYLKHDRSLRGGRDLYNKLTNKNRALQNAFSRFSDTAENVDRVCYELAKAVSMEERHLKIFLQRPVVLITKKEIPTPSPDTTLLEPTPADLLLKFDPEVTDYTEAKKIIKELSIVTENKKKDTLFKALVDARAELIKEKLQELPEEVKASIKLRDQFPFLRESNCPPELKILVNDLITAYEVFKENQPQLHDLIGENEAKTIVDTVKDNYIANKQAYAELEHYGTTQTILGEHPLFERLALKQAITEMDTPTLTKKINSLKTNISRNKQAENTDLVSRDEDLLTHANTVLKSR